MQSVYIYILSLVILVGISLCILISLKLTERFIDTQSPDETKINGYITTLSEDLCPALLFMMDDVIGEMKLRGTLDEKDKKGFQLLEYDAGGPLFPCTRDRSDPKQQYKPGSIDAVQVPANINARIQRTVKYLNRRIQRTSYKITGAMNCKKQSESELDDEKQKEEKEDQTERNKPVKDDSGSLKNADQYNQPLSEIDRAAILTLRAKSLQASMGNPGTIAQLTSIKIMTDALFAMKAAAEQNKLRPTCAKSGEDESDAVQLH